MSKELAEAVKLFISQPLNNPLTRGQIMEVARIALPILGQQKSKDVFIVVRKPGHLPYIKRPVGDIADYLMKIYQHNPSVSCDVVTYRFPGASGQWVQDGRELLTELNVELTAVDIQERGDGGWIKWKGGDQPVSDYAAVEVKFRNGSVEKGEFAECYEWNHGYHDLSTTEVDIIAYRIIPEQPTNQNGEQ